MKFFLRFIIFCSIFLLTASPILKHVDFKKAMYKNVCKELKGDVLLYFIFIDTKETSPWTDFDIRSTLDSISIAAKWISEQANKNHIQLTLKTNYYIGKPYATVTKNLPNGSVKNTVYEPSVKKGMIALNDWADDIAKKVGTTFNLNPKDGIPEVKTLRTKERLIAYLRDEYNVESVALVFMVNNYYRVDISVAVNTFSTDDVEFAIVSYKYPSEISHNILGLFGAAPLFKSVYRKSDSKIEYANKLLPNDAMQDPYAKNIYKLEIGPLTSYLIGWTTHLSKEYEKLLIDGIAF